MTKLEAKYLSWLHKSVVDFEPDNGTHKKLLSRLYDWEFTSDIYMDDNRIEDAKDLRHKYGRHSRYNMETIEEGLNYRTASVLEILISLSIRCENIMDTGDDDRTGYWFWEMVNNLGLIDATDDNFDIDTVDEALQIFINREYNPDGTGGNIYTIHDNMDIRDAELWSQMMWHINEITGGL